MGLCIFALSLLALSVFTYTNEQMVTLDINKTKSLGFVECLSGDSLLREEAVTLDKQLHLYVGNEKDYRSNIIIILLRNSVL